MKTELESRRLYAEAFALLERTNKLLLAARKKHELEADKRRPVEKAA